MNVFLALPGADKVILSCAVVFVPVFFAGIIFATTFRDSQNPSIDFGSNVGGVILGGLCEYFSLLIGFNHLIIIAMAFYFLSLALKPHLPLRLSAPAK
jgi:heme/copper-type cytochrome/quinol oxidase subunit 2